MFLSVEVGSWDLKHGNNAEVTVTLQYHLVDGIFLQNPKEHEGQGRAVVGMGKEWEAHMNPPQTQTQTHTLSLDIFLSKICSEYLEVPKMRGKGDEANLDHAHPHPTSPTSTLSMLPQLPP